MSVLQKRKITDDDFAFMCRHLGREGAFPAAEQTVKWIEQKLVGHAAPGHLQRAAGPLIESWPFVKNILRSEVEIAPLVCGKCVLARSDGGDNLRTIGIVLPRRFFVFVRPVWEET